MRECMNEFFGAMGNLINKLNGDIENINSDIEDKIAQIKILKQGISDNILEQKELASNMVHIADTFSGIANHLYMQAEVSAEVIEILNELDEDIKINEEDEDMVGICDNCGSTIYEDDDYIENCDGLFCCEECEDEFVLIGECNYCGREIYQGYGCIETDNGLFCDRECENDYIDELQESEDE